MKEIEYGIIRIKDKNNNYIYSAPKVELREDFSGYGVAKESPFYLVVNGKTKRRFKTREGALSFYKNNRRKMLKKLRSL